MSGIDEYEHSLNGAIRNVHSFKMLSLMPLLSITEMNEVESFKELEAPAAQFLGGEIRKATLLRTLHNR